VFDDAAGGLASDQGALITWVLGWFGYWGRVPKVENLAMIFSAMAIDYYKTLGVSRSASADDIKKVYKQLAAKHHPDLNPDDKSSKEKFQQIQTAYDVLSDPQKRARYDRYGSDFEGTGEGGGWQTQGGFGGAEIDLSQLFGDGGSDGSFNPLDLFGFGQSAGGGRGGRSQRAARKGPDSEVEITIDFQTSVLGGNQTLVTQHADGSQTRLELTIPPGIEDGKKIRLKGQGGPGRAGGPAGDLFVLVLVFGHRCFRRNGLDLEMTLPVSLKEAALGEKVDVPTPYGTIELKIPAGSSGGSRLRIKGHGVRKSEGKQGDLYCELSIMVPADLDQESKQLIEELDDRNPMNVRDSIDW